MCVCPTAAPALGLSSQDTSNGKEFLTPVAVQGPGTGSIWCSLTKANPEQERKLATGGKVFAKCHSSGLGKEGRAADCSDQKSQGFKKLHTSRFADPVEPEHSSAQG